MGANGHRITSVQQSERELVRGLAFRGGEFGSVDAVHPALAPVGDVIAEADIQRGRVAVVDVDHCRRVRAENGHSGGVTVGMDVAAGRVYRRVTQPTISGSANGTTVAASCVPPDACDSLISPCEVA